MRTSESARIASIFDGNFIGSFRAVGYSARDDAVINSANQPRVIADFYFTIAIIKTSRGGGFGRRTGSPFSQRVAFFGALLLSHRLFFADAAHVGCKMRAR
jgi:hypothetical protein